MGWISKRLVGDRTASHRLTAYGVVANIEALAGQGGCGVVPSLIR